MTKLNLRLNLRWKIVLIIILTVVSLGFVTLYIVNQRVSSALIDSKKETIALVSLEQTREIGQVLSFARQAADAVQQIPGVLEYMEDKNKTVQDKDVLKSITDFGVGRKFLTVFLIDQTGKTVLSVDPTLVNKNFGFRNYFKDALVGKNVSEMVIGSVTNQPGFYFSSPIKNQAGVILGVSVVKLDPQPLFATLMDSYINRLGKFMLVNDDGVIIFTNKENALYKSLGKMDPEIKKKIEEEKRYLGKEIAPLDYEKAQKWVETAEKEMGIYEFFDEEDKEMELIDVNRVGEYPFYLVSEVGSSAVTAVVGQLTQTVIFIIVFLLSLGTIIQVLILGRFLKPLSKLDKYAKSVASGNLEETVSVRTGDELESLSESIKEMVGSLKNYYVGLEDKVAEKTAELASTLKGIEEKNMDLENIKKAVLNVMEDLSEEKDKIANEKSRVETILSSIGDGVFVTDQEGKVTMINKAAQQMSGYSLFEAIGKHYTETLKFKVEADLEQPYPDFVKKVFDTGIAQSLANHTVIENRDGTVISVLDSAAPIKDVSGKIYGCVVVFRNNTRERELEKSKDDFLSVTSHQLRTPLGGMRWSLEMLLAGDAGKLPEEAETIAKEIHKGNLRMIGLVNDLLNVNRIDQGRVMDEPVKTDLEEVIREAAKELDFEASARKIKVNLHFEKAPSVFIDAKRFREVMMNLVSNAVKYNKAGGEVEVETKIVGGQVVISVSDNGVGIPKKDIPRLFNKFFRAENAVHSETEGSGLGLYVVKKFVEGWGGKINLKSVEGKGTEVIISLPLDKLKEKKQNG